jgi:DNA-binding transcriptional MerR regulator
MSARDAEHLSIGEVLAELNDEFPDITISKIRFLESQGLVNPERTPSGYRKFYPADLARLRWILYQQKEHFLPLKVIKERLDELPPGGETALFESIGEADTPESPAPAPEPAAAPAEPAPAPAARPPATRVTRSARRAPTFAPTLPADTAPDASVVDPPAGDGRYTRAELASAAGVDDAQVAQLESFGLVTPVREVDGQAEYDDDALEIVRIASGFFDRGVEARHLRMYKTAAEREAVLFGQVLMPYVRQRNPEARERLQDELGEMASLGRRLRTALLREAVREALAE